MSKLYEAVKMIFRSAGMFSVSVGTQVELELMKTKNKERLQLGQSMAYDEEHFHTLYKDHNEAIKDIVSK